ncbi:unnamed protein product [marine sediment metagenome]|uniref:Uncharacterized protein n=1 Tax=marine sediment metagenome TaxID=412755 RepID=X0X667_9ZZZZ
MHLSIFRLWLQSKKLTRDLSLLGLENRYKRIEKVGKIPSFVFVLKATAWFKFYKEQ